MTAVADAPLAFICGHRKSGTTLVRNLLDGHPQLTVYPIDLALLYAYFPDFIKVNVDYRLRRDRLQHILFDDLAEQLESLGVSSRLDVNALSRRFFAGLQDDELGEPGLLIGRLRSAYIATMGSGMEPHAGIVFKETSIEIYAAEIRDWFPQARFIQIVRDPRDNFAALAAGIPKHYSRLGEDRNRVLASLLHRARLGFRMAVRNRSAFGPENYLVLRYEELAAEPERPMHMLADFLGIDFDSVLLVPTVLGAPSESNSYDGKAVFGVTERNIGRWRDRISQEEAQIIEFNLTEEMQALGYEPAFSHSEQARAAAEFYKWQNYAYFYNDRFAPRPNS